MLTCPFCRFDNVDEALFCDRCKADLECLFPDEDFKLIPTAEPLTFPTARPPEDCKAVELADIVPNPGDFHGKRVRVVGFLHLEFEGNSLYVHRNDYEPRRVYGKALWVDIFKPIYQGPRFLGLIWEAMQNADLLNDHWKAGSTARVKGSGAFGRQRLRKSLVAKFLNRLR